MWYIFLSDWTLKECTAGPLDIFNIFDCINVLFFAISPPNASISLTRWPFEVPPILGLHGILARVSIFITNIAVFLPSLALASAASHPACPAPITITS